MRGATAGRTKEEAKRRQRGENVREEVDRSISFHVARGEGSWLHDMSCICVEMCLCLIYRGAELGDWMGCSGLFFVVGSLHRYTLLSHTRSPISLITNLSQTTMGFVAQAGILVSTAILLAFFQPSWISEFFPLPLL